MASIPVDEKPHAVFVPLPTQGHLNPLLKLAKLLHHRGFHITFVNTEYNHKRLLKSRGPNALDGLPDFRFETIPDGLPTSDADSTQHIPSLCDSTRKNCLAPFRDLLAKLNADASFPPVTCIVADGVMSFTLKASEELGIPNALFWTTSACGFMGYAHCAHLVEKGVAPFKDASYLTNGHLESTAVDWTPAMKDIRLRDIPSFIRTTDPNDIMLDFVSGEIKEASRASAIILHTFDALEYDVLVNAVSLNFPPPICTVGPLQLLLNQISDSLTSIECNLWEEDAECIQWLNSKEPNSVLYVNFGSIMVLAVQQLVELAWGLANSKQNFLWIVRPDLCFGNSAILPPEFFAETKERGLLQSWCPQEQVLNHPSTGGFLTHNGWNSTIESITSGVSMLCLPFFSDQLTNCRYACTEWGIGMEIDSDVKRSEVEKLVRELMEGEKGKKMKNKSVEWKRTAWEATNPGGSSYLNLVKLVKILLSNTHKNHLQHYSSSCN